MLLRKTCRLSGTHGGLLKGRIGSLLCLSLLCTGAFACGPGRSGTRRRSPRKLTPLVFKQHVPNVPESSLAASGPPEQRIRRGDERFMDLVPNYNKDIVFKDRSSNGADRLATQRCKERLDTLAISVMNQWPGVRLRVTEGFDEDGYHAPNSLHYNGRAVDITTSDRDTSKYGMLARLAVEAGFDWVYYESRSHIHCSVKKESVVPSRASGCFHGNSSIFTRKGIKRLMDLTEGDEVASGFHKNGSLTYSKVIAFLHRDHQMENIFVQLRTESGHNLRLTTNHLIFRLADHGPQAIHASLVQPGDFLFTRSQDDGVTVSKVTDVTFLTLLGVYAPLTLDGTLLVDDVWVSCYAVVSSHGLAHAVFFPVRLLHVISALNFNLKILLWNFLFTKNKPTTEEFLTNSTTAFEGGRRGYIHWYPRVLCWIVNSYSAMCE